MTNHYIAQTSTNTLPQPPSALTEWGILGAILFFVVKEGIGFIKQKDSSEANLTNSLISDIRETNKELREYLEADKRASDKVIQALQNFEQRITRNTTEFLVSNREQIVKMQGQLDALHKRLDRSGIVHTHPHKEDDY